MDLYTYLVAHDFLATALSSLKVVRSPQSEKKRVPSMILNSYANIF